MDFTPKGWIWRKKKQQVISYCPTHYWSSLVPWQPAAANHSSEVVKCGWTPSPNGQAAVMAHSHPVVAMKILHDWRCWKLDMGEICSLSLCPWEVLLPSFNHLDTCGVLENLDLSKGLSLPKTYLWKSTICHISGEGEKSFSLKGAQTSAHTENIVICTDNLVYWTSKQNLRL